MLDSIIAFSLKNRLLVAAASVAVAIAGTFAVLRMPIDVLPDLDRPVVTVLSEARGYVAEDVELLVTRPIEQAVNGATGVFRVRSSSAAGLSVVYVEFDWNMDLYLARQVVAEKLQTLELPPGAHTEMAPVSSIMGQILVVGLRGAPGGTSQQELRQLVERELQPRLRSVPGVAQVVTTGGRQTELQVEVDAARLTAHDLTLTEVRDAVRSANVDVTGGLLPIGASAPAVTVSGRVRAPDQLGAALVRTDPTRPLAVRDVADVRLGPSAIGVGDAGVDGESGVLVVVTKQPKVDTVGITERLLAELDQLRAALPPDVQVVTDVFRQADFIERAIGNVLEAVRDGAILVVLVLFVFLLNLRTTLITLTAIPLSVAIAAIVFELFGLSIDTMTLGGLAVAVGTLVDDAIVDVENVYRRLHENARRGGVRAVFDVVLDASREVRKPVTYGTILVTVVYLPLFFLSGIEGRLFAPIGLAYIVSVGASLLVALTLTPALCYWLLGSARFEDREYGGRLVDALRNAVQRGVEMSMRRPTHVLGLVISMSLCAAVALASRGSTFLPPFNEGSAQVNLMLPPATSLETSDRFGQRLEDLLLDVDGVQHVARRTGRAEGDEHIMPVSVTEALVTFDPQSPRGREEILEDIRHRLGDAFPGVPNETEQPLAHLLSHMLSGVTAQVAIKIEGPDLRRLRELARDVEAAIAGIAGVRDLIVEPLVMVEQVEVRPRRDELARQGVRLEDLADTIELALGGEQIGRMPDGRISHPIKVRLRAGDRDDLDALRALRVRDAAGQLVRVGDVADVRFSRTPNEIKRENVSRRIVVKHNVAERALGDVVADVERAVAPIRAQLAETPGYSLRLGGQFESQREATRIVLSLSVVSLLVMLLVLHLHFGSLRIAMLVLLTRPIAFIGAVAAVVITGQDLSVATLVGLIALLGMAARNAILLIEHVLHLMQQEGEGFTIAMMVRACRERVVPVMMTALTSGIGLVPLTLSPDEPGRELLYPVATVIVGGLITNTLLDFLVTPGVLNLFGREACERLAARRDERR
ncbi:MAG: efflux RND transporter permease subunit [Planctomycetes bacterium]|nr:efflux RND transporter permease subunit [Planctomycetota bacterium]